MPRKNSPPHIKQWAPLEIAEQTLFPGRDPHSLTAAERNRHWRMPSSSSRSAPATSWNPNPRLMPSFFSPDTSNDITLMSDLPLPEVEQGGYAINLIVAVRDHAPARIDAIQKEVRELTARMQELQTEEQTLAKLLAVVS